MTVDVDSSLFCRGSDVCYPHYPGLYVIIIIILISVSTLVSTIFLFCVFFFLYD